MVRAQKKALVELQGEAIRATRRAWQHKTPPRISSGVWIRLRIATALARDKAEADLAATHLIRGRVGKRAGTGGEAGPPLCPGSRSPVW